MVSGSPAHQFMQPEEMCSLGSRVETMRPQWKSQVDFIGQPSGVIQLAYFKQGIRHAKGKIRVGLVVMNNT